MIRTSNDGGVTWTPRASGAIEDLWAVSCTNSNCIVAGSFGTILTSTDNGTTWTRRVSGTPQFLYGLSCVSSSLCVAVGSSGAILTSNDIGLTWALRTSGTVEFLYGVSCANGSLCVAVGSNGAILSSSNNGVTWSTRVSGTPQYLNGVSCFISNQCVAVGDSGTILTTSDAGSTWTSRMSGAPFYLNSVSCTNGSQCAAVGGCSSGTAFCGSAAGPDILTSNDGGLTWSSRTAYTPDVPLSVSCTSNGQCVAAGFRLLILTGALPVLGTTPTSTPITTPTSSPTSTVTRTPTVTLTQLPTSTPTVTTTPSPFTGSITGGLILQGRPAPPNSLQQGRLTVTVYLASNSSVVGVYSVDTDANGSFTLTGLPSGTYHVRIKHPLALSRLVKNVIVSAGGNAQIGSQTAPVGDSDNNDQVDIVDFSLLRSMFGSATTCGTIVPTPTTCADYDGTGQVDIVDFSLLRSNFGQTGPSLS